jgi:hypothetical protein
VASDKQGRAFLELNGAKLPPLEEKERVPSGGLKKGSGGSLARSGGPKRTGRPRRVSDKQAARSAFLSGVKAERIWHQLFTEGKASCENCPASWTSFAAAKGHLDLHHTEKRSRGQGYRDGNMGVDAPRLVVLLCRPCHREAEASEPQWTGTEGGSA